MYSEDIVLSQAYARSLRTVGLLSDLECSSIEDGLNIIKQEWIEGKFIINEEDEDIHTANERRLKVGSRKMPIVLNIQYLF